MKTRILLLALAVILLQVGSIPISVDLGSEWMKVGVVSPGVPMEIALNKESKRKTPSIIAFRDDGTGRVFGEDGQTLGLRFPSSSFGYLIDLLGKTVDHPIVQLYKKRFPYYNIEGDQDRNTVVFRVGEETYRVEELVAQLLQKAREFAIDYTGQVVTGTVIIVPGYFGQAERNAMLASARLANMKVLQLINDYTAVALNYGIFRRKEINETAQYFIFYDMGAYKTSAAVVSYQLVKDKATKETLPVVQVLGASYDRTLGGLEMQLRLRDFLAKKFNELKKTKTDVFTNQRALAKLFKEAGRVKTILSANTETFAQIEGLLEEHDFKVKVERSDFESICEDLFGRAPKVFENALKSAGLTIDTISQVVLFGGAQRVPKVQQVLKDTIKMELSKNLNADEAAAMGAVYRGADLATGFKVKKFVTKDAVLFPIQVVFNREGETGDRKVKRTLFSAMNSYPQKKVITFNKHTSDFNFEINYADLEHLSAEEIRNLGSLNLTTVSLSGVGAAIKEKIVEGVESKGIKAHFALDDSGIFGLVNVELVLEKPFAEEEEEGTLSKLGSTISKLFSGDSKDSEKNPEDSDEKPTDQNQSEEEAKGDTLNDTLKNDTMSNGDTQTSGAKNATSGKPKIMTVKEPIEYEVKNLYTAPLDGEQYTESLKIVVKLDQVDQQKRRKETAFNSLESFVIEAQMRLDQDEYRNCATESEAKNILKACSEISEWLYEDGIDAEADVYEKKLSNLQETANEVYARHWEHQERPEALKALKAMLNGSQEFLKSAKNLTKDNNVEKGVFSAKEIENLEKAIQETQSWKEEEQQAQEKLARNEPVRLTVQAITEKMSLLDREVKYLVNKLKSWRPPTTKKPKEDVNTTEEAQKTENVEPPPVVEEKEETAQEPDSGQSDVEEEDEEVIRPSETETSEETKHTEL